jgi:excisionase family DNA binding protein
LNIKLLKPEEIANILGVSRSTAMRMLHESQIPTIRLRAGKRKNILRVDEAALERWIHSREREGQRAKMQISKNGNHSHDEGSYDVRTIEG